MLHEAKKNDPFHRLKALSILYMINMSVYLTTLIPPWQAETPQPEDGASDAPGEAG